MTLLARIALIASIAFATPAIAAPADCSSGPIADKPVSGTVGGKPFEPKEVDVDFTRNGMSVDDAKFDKYTLSIMTDGIFNELTVSMLVPLGKKLDGRTFRVLPTDSIGDQPAAVKGVPEVQGWDLQLEAADVDTSFTQEIASIRVEWGSRTGNTIGGKIHFCVPGQKAQIEGRFNATMR
jgi:hypothetical protein